MSTNETPFNYSLNTKYQEILILHHMLEEEQIPHTIERSLDGWQIGYPVSRASKDCILDVIQHFGSYGARENLLEIMGDLLTPEEARDDVVAGYLSASNVFDRIKKHYESCKGE